MPIISNDLNAIVFRKDFSYAKTYPTFVSMNTGGPDEIARWVLDRNDILYKDEPHAPHLYTKAVNKLTGKKIPGNNPVLVMTDALIYRTDSIVNYFEQRCLPEKKLLPTDSEKRNEVIELYNLFGDELEDKVSKYVMAEVLTSKKTAKKLFKQRVPQHEKFKLAVGYGKISRSIKKEMNIAANTPAERLFEIKKVFEKVSSILSDGRRYLTGNTFSLADLAFAATAASLILPVEYGGTGAAGLLIYQVPDEMRKTITELRATAAGQFVLRLYQEERPDMHAQEEIPEEPSGFKLLLKRLGIRLAAGQPGLFYFLQRRFPVLKIPFVKLLTVNKNDLLVEFLNRDEDFTVEEINSEKMSDQKGAFFLGMDRMNPQFNRERNFVRKATKKDDLDNIRTFVRTKAEEIVSNAKQYGKLDVANTLDHPVLIGLLAYYFGVTTPSEPKMKEWCSRLFYDLFLNFKNNKEKHQLAVKAAFERKTWTLEIIKQYRQDLKDGKTIPDNLLSRLLIMAQEPGNEWANDESLERNIGGLLTGILETTNKSVIFALDVLFRNPDVLPGAIEAAHSMDTKKMFGYVSEALRFNPVQPGVIRYCESKQFISGMGDKNYTIPAKSKVFALTACAMFDPAAFPEPKKFNPNRESAVYMNYGFGPHECYGKYINSITIPELVAAVLRLKNVRRAAGWAGRGTGLKLNSFPNNFVVEFDS